MPRLELPLLAFFVACWFVAALSWFELISLAGSLTLSLYPLYSACAALGWLFGNVYVHRSHRLSLRPRSLLLLPYYLGPLGLVYLLRATAPAEVQIAAPFVPLYCFGVFSVLFLVPVTLRAATPTSRGLRLGRRPPKGD